MSDASLLKLVIDPTQNGVVPPSIRHAGFLVVELGRLQSKNEIASGLVAEMLMARSWAGLPTILLLHTDPRFRWKASRSDYLETVLESLDTEVEEFNGCGAVTLTDLRDYAKPQQLDDGSVPDLDDCQADYAEHHEEHDWSA